MLLLGLVLLHLALLWAAMEALRPHVSAPMPRETGFRIMLPTPPPRPVPRRWVNAQQAPALGAQRPITAPTLVVAEPSAVAPTTPALAASAATPLRLDTHLSRETLAALNRTHNPAVDDPRSNSPHLSLDERMAIAMGSVDCFLDERLPDGSVRRFQGQWQSQPTLAGSADPFGHSFSTGGGFGNEAGVTSKSRHCVKK